MLETYQGKISDVRVSIQMREICISNLEAIMIPYQENHESE